MKRWNDLKFYVWVLAVLCWIGISPASKAWAHSGHDHSVQPSISLPDTLAKVNGAEIKKSAIWPALTRTVQRYKDRGIPLSREQEKIASKKLLQDQINRHLLLEKAGKLGVTISEGQINREVERVKKQFNSEEEFNKQLKSRNLTLAKYRKELKEDLLIDGVTDRELGKDIKVTDQQIQDYFKKNSGQFSSPEQRRASVILIKINPKAGSKGNRKARKTIEKIVSKLSQGADFADLARQFSQDSLAKKGGDLGFFTKDRMFGPFSKRAFKLKVGQVSDIFKTRHGYQILKLTGIKPKKQGTLESEKETIRKILIDEQLKVKIQPYLEALRKQAKIKIYF